MRCEHDHRGGLSLSPARTGGRCCAVRRRRSGIICGRTLPRFWRRPCPWRIDRPYRSCSVASSASDSTRPTACPASARPRACYRSSALQRHCKRCRQRRIRLNLPQPVVRTRGTQMRPNCDVRAVPVNVSWHDYDVPRSWLRRRIYC